ncbi:carboxymuconolactone decarboxylase family protein [Arthrobacter agilis]|uniref:carboxymuconolactone decarboxylase family protein n=1 Tax=Arthrobacter agilis TaxID=37921 RepID=UPI002782542B|nr:carboxymuconolactone decarboxylase family protein [Arthrobacter agilis]MDQ0734995.1 AhpD family alkylhydroperoxidase [Arthrobacter agilis]
MITKEKTARTNVGSRHPQLYRALTPVARLADMTALEEGLSPLLIELVKLRASQLNGCAFCLRTHSQDALDKGESPVRLNVLSAWRESEYFDEAERSALALTEYLTLIQDSHRNAGLYEAAAAHLTSGQMSAVTWVVLIINTYNRIAISGAYRVAP